MRLLERILVAIDSSDSAKNIVKYAIEMAKTFKSAVTLIHVLPDERLNVKERLILKKAALERLKNLSSSLESEGVLGDQPIIVQGEYADKINNEAEKRDVNLILIGSALAAETEKEQLGSTAMELIRNSDRPVWVVRHKEAFKIRNIFCPVSFSSESKRALRNSIMIASKLKAELVIFSVYTIYDKFHPRFDPESRGMNNLVSAKHDKMLGAFLEDFNLTDINYRIVSVGGNPAEEILLGISTNSSDLLIMGTSGKSILSRFLIGSVTEKVIRKVPCSFVTLKTENILR